MDEFGMVGEKKKSKLNMDKRKTLLAMFAMHMASKYSLPFDEAMLDAEIDEFLKGIDEMDAPKKAPNNRQVSKRAAEPDEEEETGYHG